MELVLASTLSLPLFTKYVYKKRINGNFVIKLCHYRDVLGPGFFQFEVVLNALIFPVIPCIVIFPLNILLLYSYHKGQTSMLTSVSDKEVLRKCNLLVYTCNLYFNLFLKSGVFQSNALHRGLQYVNGGLSLPQDRPSSGNPTLTVIESVFWLQF